MNRKLRMGMVGGGRGAFIGAVHRMAAALDGQIELVAGCFSADPEKSLQSGNDLLLPAARVYGSYEEMAEREAALPENQRIDFVSIVTRNDTHFPIARAFASRGIHVVCDKPLALSFAEARKFRTAIEKSGVLFCLTHTYTGYPMVKQAREFVREGKLGKLLKVVVEYPQGYALSALDNGEEGKISNWRMNPKLSGASNCMGDIGTHAHNLVTTITGLEIESLCADLSTFIPGRPLDDDGSCLLRFKGGAKGVLFASQVCSGEENSLRIRVYGTDGSLEWHQEHPNELHLRSHRAPAQTWRRGNGYVSDEAKRFTRVPFGHPEGYIEAFANIYVEFARALRDRLARKSRRQTYDFPTVVDGVRGMAFVESVVKSSRAGAKWVKFPAV